MKIGIFGMGAVGCAIYGELYGYEELYVLADEKRARGYEANGFIINDKKIYPRCITDKKMDLILICVKNYQLSRALPDIAVFADESTVLLPLLNGITARDVLCKYFPDNTVLYGVINVEANKTENIVKTGKIINLQFGEEYNTPVKKYLSDISDIFTAFNIKHHIYPNMKQRVWRKWMLNMGINQVSALCNATYRDMAHPLIQDLLAEIFLEVYAVSEAYHAGLTPEDVEETIQSCKAFRSERVTSLTLDFLQGGENELDIFSPALIRLAEARNMSVPVNQTLYRLLKSMNDNRKSKRNQD